MKIPKLLSIALFATTIIYSCKKKSPDVDPYDFSVNEISIKDSTKLMFVITPEGNDLGKADSNELFQITSKGSVSKFKINSNTGNDVSGMFKPAKLSNVSEKYFLMTISRNTGSGSEGYLLNKTTNELISISPNRKVPVNGEFAAILNHPFTLNDGKGNVYYIAYDVSNGNSSLAKININNPSASTITYLTPDSIKRVTSFDIDKDGNVLADVDGISGKRWCILFNENTTQKLQDISIAYWRANDGIFRNASDDGYIEKIDYDKTNKKITVSKEIKLQTFSISNNFLRDNSYLVYHNDLTIILSKNQLFEYYPVEKKIKQITTVPITSTKWVDHSKALGHLYVAGESATGQETIFNIDLSNYSYKTYPEAGKYTFYEIEAFEDGTIYATAKRKSDGKNVVLKFAPDGTETVLYDQLGNKKGIWLEKVTEFVND